MCDFYCFFLFVFFVIGVFIELGVGVVDGIDELAVLLDLFGVGVVGLVHFAHDDLPFFGLLVSLGCQLVDVFDSKS